MVGAITARDILAHPVITIRCFGWGVFFRALFAGQRQTFLSLLPKADARAAPASRWSALVDRCVNLELRARRVYAAFARAFADQPAASRFFDALARQEEEHAHLLALCGAATDQSGWVASYSNPWEQYVPCLEQHLEKVETALREVGSLDEALQLVVQIESAEINRVFEGLLAASNSAFVKRLKAFRRAVDTHISFIARRLPEMAPQLASDAAQLRSLFPEER
jgi:hypothetical protein